MSDKFSQPLLLSVTQTPGGTAVYAARWGMLAMYAFTVGVNGFLWLAFAPIAKSTSVYYQIDPECIDNGSCTWVNMLSIVFMIMFIPGSILGMYLYDKYSLRTGVVLATALQFLGAVLRFVSTMNEDTIRPSWAYPMLLLGTAFIAISQPMLTNVATRLAGEWFPVSQRDLATIVGSVFNPIGSAVSQGISPLIVTGPEVGMAQFLRIQLGGALLCFILIGLFFKSAPPLPPSRSTLFRRDSRRQLKEQGNKPSVVTEQLLKFKTLLSNYEFRKLAFSFGLGVGMFQSVLTVIGQLVGVAGYGDDDAGLFGSLAFGTGLFSAGIVGYVLAKTQKYNTILKIGGVSILAAYVFLLFMIKPDNFGLLAFAFGLLGFCALPLLPTTFQCGVECTYPLDEEVSTSFLQMAGQAFGVGLTFLLDYLISTQPVYKEGRVSSVDIAIIGCMCFCAVPFLSYNGKYLRLEHERATHHQDTTSPVSPANPELNNRMSADTGGYPTADI